ncbi:MAG: carbohydrate kinase family protein [Chloroflexi bacterium]|nr:carbohydrate kinase family protein [Chloroflexota bacterium]MCI0785306.1 carbohydrate kinase family protein [Chloroflexota bacterium]MCI0793453.1 carbohydrate kinase family protein [Chloroflexota bacterium]MCI0797716.1 carbohydrate kinase family protein [Chloroflexota bacterium]
MDVLVSGSLAYDRIMDFPGLFSDHIMADQLHNINVSFTVSSLAEKYGGTAGNIGYSLALLGENPRILATVGHDYHQYFQWLEDCGLATEDIRIIPEELTASAYITTDTDGNQITGFNPGAMKHPSLCDLSKLDPSQCVAIVAPGNIQDMAEYIGVYQDKGIFAIFDPGQSLPAWGGADLAAAIGRSKMLVSNDYELGLINNMTGLSVHQLLQNVETVITTKGDQGTEVTSQGGAVTVPAIPTGKVVDPTGAGDAFRGGLIKGLIQGQPVKRSVEMGTVCAHYVIQTKGTQEYRFTLAEFEATLAQHFGPDPAL